mgnify:CR=1 FL=1
MKNYTEVLHAESPDYSTYVSKGSRFQEIKYTKKGNPYVVRNHQRFPIDLFECRPDGKAYHFLTMGSCLSLEIDPNGEMAMVRYEYTAHSSAYRKKYNW